MRHLKGHGAGRRRGLLAVVAATIGSLGGHARCFCGTSAASWAAAGQRAIARRAREQQEGEIHRLFFINLDRRVGRRLRFQQRAEALGLRQVLARFPAVDGRALDLDEYPRHVVSEAGLRAAASPPPVVNGGHLTRGAVGLILSYHTLLTRIAADQKEEHVYVVAEDDAVLCDSFSDELGTRLAALRQEDPLWDFVHIGYYEDDCSLKSLDSPANVLLCEPKKVYGLFGAALRPQGARQLLKYLFPLNEQIDSALSNIYGQVRAYATRPSLMKAEHSTAGNSDIQLLPEGFRFKG